MFAKSEFVTDSLDAVSRARRRGAGSAPVAPAMEALVGTSGVDDTPAAAAGMGVGAAAGAGAGAAAVAGDARADAAAEDAAEAPVAAVGRARGGVLPLRFAGCLPAAAEAGTAGSGATAAA